MKRILITGGAGFIGSHLVEQLAKDGHKVASFDNYSASSGTNLAYVPQAVSYQGDVTRQSDVDSVFKFFDPDVVFHLATSKKNVCLDNPRRDLTVNAYGTLLMLQTALRHKVERFVYASTGSVYGNGPFGLSAATYPVSHYGVSKLAAERYVMMYRKTRSLNATALRYFHVYGPRQNDSDDRGGVVAIFCRRALQGLPLVVHGDGRQTRSFTYVKDVVQATAKLATMGKVAPEYNIASGVKISVLDLASRVLRLAGEGEYEHGKVLPGDIRSFSIKPCSPVPLEWTCFTDGLCETFKWYKRKYA